MSKTGKVARVWQRKLHN